MQFLCFCSDGLGLRYTARKHERRIIHYGRFAPPDVGWDAVHGGWGELAIWLAIEVGNMVWHICVTNFARVFIKTVEILDVEGTT